MTQSGERGLICTTMCWLDDGEVMWITSHRSSEVGVHSMGRCDVLPGEMGNSNPLDPWVVNEKVGKWT